MPLRPLDALDRKLLDAVQRDASRKAEALGTEIGLSASAVQRRLARLKQEGVIAAEMAVVDPRKLGNVSTFIVGLNLESEKADLLARLRSWAAAEDAVQQAFYVTGVFDFVLIVTAASVEAYEALMARLLKDNPNVKRFSTMSALGISKRTLFVPTGDSGA